MRGMRKVPKPSRGRRFPKTVDESHLETVRRETCLLRGKRTTVLKWVGVYPNREQVAVEYMHVCWYDRGKSDPHHTVKKSKGGHDGCTVPLCRTAHDEAEALTNDEFLARWGIDLDSEGERRMAVYKARKESA